MSPSEFDKYPKELQEKIRLSREAFKIAKQLSEKIEGRFHINDLNVAASMQQSLTISGMIKTETEKEEIKRFVNTEMPGWDLNLNLHINQ